MRHFLKSNILKLNSGYSIIELAIVILVIGVVAGSGADIYKVYNANQTQATNVNNVTQVAQSVGGFLTRFGRYPCPADISLPRTDPNYGMESQCDPLQTTAGIPPNSTYPTGIPPNTTNPYVELSNSSALAPGACTAHGGICIQASADFSPSALPPLKFPVSAPPGTVLVRRGGIPFRAMNIPETLTLDAYGNRLQYAVTEPLAVATSYDKTGGGIDVFDVTSAQTAHGIHFVILSTGADQAGAYSRDGVKITPCGTTNVLTSDAQNCTTSGLATFTTALYNPNIGATNHYDDTLQFFTSMSTPMWGPDQYNSKYINDRVTATMPASMVSLGALNADPKCIDPNGCRVVVGTETPTTTMDVENTSPIPTVLQPGVPSIPPSTPFSVQTSSKLMAGTLCDDKNTNCLVSTVNGALPSTMLITGDDANMKCPKSTDPPTAIYVAGFSGNQAVCSQVLSVNCPTGQFVGGINPDGSLICNSIITQCPAGAVAQSDLDAPGQTMSEYIGCHEPPHKKNLEYIAYDPTVWLTSPVGSGSPSPVGTSINVVMSQVMAAAGAGGISTIAGGAAAQKQMLAWLANPMPPGALDAQYNDTDTYTCMPDGFWHYQYTNGWCGCPPTPAGNQNGSCSSMAVQYQQYLGNLNNNIPNNFTGFGTAPYNETWSQTPTGIGGTQCGGAWANGAYNSSFFFPPGAATPTYTYSSQNAENSGAQAMVKACDACNAGQSPMTQDLGCNPWGGVGGYNTGDDSTVQKWDCGISTDLGGGLLASGGWDAPVEKNTCDCIPGTSTDNPGCPNGFTGNITTKTTVTCGPKNSNGYSTIATIVGPIVTSNTCTATCQPDDVETFACSDPTVQTYDPAAYLPTANKGNVVMARKFNCATQTFDSAWTPISSTCGCNGNATQTQYTTCPGNQVGQLYQTSTYDCTTGTYGPWTRDNTKTTCAPASQGHWSAVSGAANSTPYASNPTPNTVGGSCTAGNAAACSQQVSGGWTYYQTCYCQ